MIRPAGFGVPARTVIVGACLVAVLAGCTAGAGGGESPSAAAPSAAAPSGAPTVVAEGFAFEPAVITVPVGGTIDFVNRDQAEHTVTEGVGGQAAADARFDETLDDDPAAVVSITFPEAGTVAITCRFHPAMQLAVTVGDAAPAPSAGASPAASPAASSSPASKGDY